MIPEGYEPPTQEQRGLYWVWMQHIEKEIDMPKDEVHEAFKNLFLQGKSSMKLHRIQFTDYMDKINAWCAENGITLPEPISDQL